MQSDEGPNRNRDACFLVFVFFLLNPFKIRIHSLFHVINHLGPTPVSITIPKAQVGGAKKEEKGFLKDSNSNLPIVEKGCQMSESLLRTGRAMTYSFALDSSPSCAPLMVSLQLLHQTTLFPFLQCPLLGGGGVRQQEPEEQGSHGLLSPVAQLFISCKCVSVTSASLLFSLKFQNHHQVQK